MLLYICFTQMLTKILWGVSFCLIMFFDTYRKKNNGISLVCSLASVFNTLWYLAGMQEACDKQITSTLSGTYNISPILYSYNMSDLISPTFALIYLCENVTLSFVSSCCNQLFNLESLSELVHRCVVCYCMLFLFLTFVFYCGGPLWFLAQCTIACRQWCVIVCVWQRVCRAVLGRRLIEDNNIEWDMSIEKKS